MASTEIPSMVPIATPTPLTMSTTKDAQVPLRTCSALDAVYGEGAETKIRAARILVVGAGGVGCELVKNLAAAGFGEVIMIDLDTIDFSNLNRQFLFRRHHVGKPKATEAASSIRTMIPDVNVSGLMANIKEPRFSVQFFKTFSLVCNALDNLEARRHVNRMCLAAKIALIDSGSTGYNGQCDVIGPGYECYDCISRPTPKSYAVCTIRSTPEKPVHCIVWAKHLFELVFGPPDADNLLADLDGGVDPNTNESGRASDSAATGIADTNGHARGHAQTVDTSTEAKNAAVEPVETPKEEVTDAAAPRSIPKRVRFLETDSPDTFATRVCERVYEDDIAQQRRMTSLWESRAPPLVCHVAKLAKNNSLELADVNVLSQTAWSVETSAAVFYAVLKSMVINRASVIGSLSFDKDDRDALMFVTAAANLRAHAYGVELQSPFSVKGIAGNIVHAVATTNAMVGGLIVLEALKIVVSGGYLTKCTKTFVGLNPMGSRVPKLLQVDPMRPPNRKCFVCSQGQLQLSLDADEMLLKTLVSSVLQKRMSVLQPSVYVTTGDYENTVYECGSGLDEDEIADYEANLKKRLRQLRIEDGSQLVVEDFAQNITCRLHVRHVVGLLEESPVDERFTLDGDVPEDNGKVNGSTQDADEGTVNVEDDEVPEVPLSDSKPNWAMLEAGKTNDVNTDAYSLPGVNGKKRALGAEIAVHGQTDPKKVKFASKEGA